MGWNLHLSVVRGRTTADFAALGMFGVSPEATTADRASSLASPAVAQAADDLLFIDGGMVALQFNTVLAARLGAEVVTALFSSVSDTYVWSVLQPDGTSRTLAVAAGSVVEDEGVPLPEEAALDGAAGLGEDALFGLLEARTGLPADWLELPAYPLVG